MYPEQRRPNARSAAAWIEKLASSANLLLPPRCCCSGSLGCLKRLNACFISLKAPFARPTYTNKRLELTRGSFGEPPHLGSAVPPIPQAGQHKKPHLTPRAPEGLKRTAQTSQPTETSLPRRAEGSPRASAWHPPARPSRAKLLTSPRRGTRAALARDRRKRLHGRLCVRLSARFLPLALSKKLLWSGRRAERVDTSPNRQPSGSTLDQSGAPVTSRRAHAPGLPLNDPRQPGEARAEFGRLQFLGALKLFARNKSCYKARS